MELVVYCGKQAEGDQADHDGFIVHAADKVQKHHRVCYAEPQRQRRITADGAGQARDSPGDGREPQHRNDLVDDDAGSHVLTHEVSHPIAHPQVQRAIRRGGIAPVVGDLEEERAGINRRTLDVRIETIAHHRPLHEVGVDVARGQGSSNEQRCNPRGQHAADTVQAAIGLRVLQLRGDDLPAGQHPRGDEAEQAYPVEHHANVAAVPVGQETNVEGLEHAAAVAGGAARKGRECEDGRGRDAQGKGAGNAHA